MNELKELRIVDDVYSEIQANPGQDYIIFGFREHYTQDLFFSHAVRQDFSRPHVWNIEFNALRRAVSSDQPILIPVLNSSYGGASLYWAADALIDNGIFPVAHRSFDMHRWHLYDVMIQKSLAHVLSVSGEQTGDLHRMIPRIRRSIDREAYSL